MRHTFQTNHYINTSQLKECINPVDFYSQEGQEIAIQGKNSWRPAGLCPFHADKQTGSFYINVENGAYKCFSCGVGGSDIIDFTRKKYNLSFKEAISELNNIWRAS